ncbi:hypothetical protein AVEN_133831-2-1, partial [Araneus ventricosus]
FRPRLALFPVVGTGRIDVARGVVSASVVFRVLAINISHIKGPDSAIASVHSSAAEIFAKLKRSVCSNSIDHSPQVQTSSDSKFGQATRRWNKALNKDKTFRNILRVKVICEVFENRLPFLTAFYIFVYEVYKETIL